MKNKIPEEFKEGTRIVLLLHRNKKGGPSNNTDRKCRKKISFNKDEFNSIMSEFKEIKDNSSKKLRIYSTVNRRNIKKGIRKFKELQLDMDYADELSKNNFYRDIRNRFISRLQKPSSRDETFFLIDVDEYEDEPQLEEVKKELKENEVEIIMEYDTENGTHIITKPYNPSKTPKANIKKDALLLLDY